MVKLSATLFVPCALLLLLFCSSEAQFPRPPACSGIFDFYFLLDSSGSIGIQWNTRVVPFVSNVTSLYTEPDFRISITTFSDNFTTHLSITRTADRAAIEAGLQSLRDHELGGGSNLIHGGNATLRQIKQSGGDRASVILVLTDGALFDETPQLQLFASTARNQLGARIFAIGIGNALQSQLELLTGSSDQVFRGNSFDYLSEVISRIREAICVEITSVTPASVCILMTESVVLNGSGFSSNLQADRATCRFQASSGAQFSTTPSGQITNTRIECPLPVFNETGPILLQVSLDGRTFIGSDIALLVDDCKTINRAEPDEWCWGREPDLVILTGSGYSALLDQSQAQCRFRTTSGTPETFFTTPRPITETTIMCPVPQTSYIGILELQVTNNGQFYIDDIVRIDIMDCTSLGRVRPSEWCLGETRGEVEILGEGFTDSYVPEAASCTFTDAEGNTYMTTPSQDIRPSSFFCSIPELSLPVGNLRLTINNGFRVIGERDVTINDCSVIESLNPGRLCTLDQSAVTEIEARGQGLNGNADTEMASCTFRTEDGDVYVTNPTQVITATLFVCPLPDVNFTKGSVFLQLYNGYMNVGGEQEFRVEECLPFNFIVVIGVLLGILGLFLILLCCLLWCFLPLCTGTIVGGLPKEEKKKPRSPSPQRSPSPAPPPPAPAPPPPRPGRKWEVVDASYYGGRGAGGMRPMKVTWGGKGATELGSKLTKAKDANLIEVVVVAGEKADPMTTVIESPASSPVPPPVVVATKPDKTPGCWDKLKACWGRVKGVFSRWYAVIRSYRPVFTYHGTLGKRVILWFPGPNIEKKLAAQRGSSAQTLRWCDSTPSSPSPSPTTTSPTSRRPPPPAPFRRPPPPAPAPPPLQVTASREQLLSD